jgi:Uma2 family endonuclease
MVATPIKPSLAVEQPQPELVSPEVSSDEVLTLEEFLAHPTEQMEWVDGQLVEKTGMTVKHGLVQGKLVQFLRNKLDSLGEGGQAVTEVACRTLKQVRRPDVAYIPAELMAEVEEATVSPQVFPLIAEVASPDDSAEILFEKSAEYIEAGCQEVWLLFPGAKLVMTKVTDQPWRLFNPGETVESAIALPGFSISVNDLLL